MGVTEKEVAAAEFIEMTKTPEFFFHKLHDVEIIGPICRFLTVTYRRSQNGVLYKEPVFSACMPAAEIGNALALAATKLGMSALSEDGRVNAFLALSRDLLMN